MIYPWPPEHASATLDESLEIAMNYLEGTGQAFPNSEAQKKVAFVILAAWRGGVRHKIRLANYGILAVANKSEMKSAELCSFHPRVS